MLKAIPKAIVKTFNRFTLDGVAIVGLTLFFFISLSLLLYAAGMSFSEGIKDTFTAFMGVLAAIATLWAAHSASLSAKAARDSADQWKNQMVFEKRISAGLEVVAAMHRWRHTINVARYTSLKDLKDTTTGDHVPDRNVERLRDLVKSEVAKIENVFSNLSTQIDCARILGVYDEESELAIKRAHSEYHEALLNVDLNLQGAANNHFRNPKYIASAKIVCYEAGKEQNFDNTLLDSWRDFEIRYKAQLVKMGGEGFQISGG
jgi:hypothetical protein